MEGAPSQLPQWVADLMHVEVEARKKFEEQASQLSIRCKALEQENLQQKLKYEVEAQKRGDAEVALEVTTQEMHLAVDEKVMVEEQLTKQKLAHDELIAAFADVSLQLQVMTDARAKAVAELSSEREQVLSLTGRVTALEHEANQQAALLTPLQAELISLQKQIQERSHAPSAATTELLATQAGSIAALESQLASAGMERERLQAESTDLQKQVTALESQVAQLELSSKKTDDQTLVRLEAFESEKARAAAELAICQDRVAGLRKALEESQVLIETTVSQHREALVAIQSEHAAALQKLQERMSEEVRNAEEAGATALYEQGVQFESEREPLVKEIADLKAKLELAEKAQPVSTHAGISDDQPVPSSSVVASEPIGVELTEQSVAADVVSPVVSEEAQPAVAMSPVSRTGPDVVGLQQQILALTVAVEEKSRSVSEQQSAVELLQKRLDEDSSENARVIEKLSYEVVDLRNEVAEKKALILEAERIQGELRSELEQSRATLEQLLARPFEAEINNLSHRLHQAHVLSISQTELVNELRGQLLFEQTFRAPAELAVSLQKSLAAAEAKIVDLNDEVQMLTGTITLLRTDISDLTGKADKIRTDERMMAENQLQLVRSEHAKEIVGIELRMTDAVASLRARLDNSQLEIESERAKVASIEEAMHRERHTAQQAREFMTSPTPGAHPQIAAQLLVTMMEENERLRTVASQALRYEADSQRLADMQRLTTEEMEARQLAEKKRENAERALKYAYQIAATDREARARLEDRIEQLLTENDELHRRLKRTSSVA